MIFYDIEIFRHFNNKGDESHITAAEAYNIPLYAISDFITNYVSGEYEITVKEHKE